MTRRLSRSSTWRSNRGRRNKRCRFGIGEPPSISSSSCSGTAGRYEYQLHSPRDTPLYKKPKTESSIRDVKLPRFVVEALCEQRKRTWKGEGDNFVFLIKEGRHLHRHTLNRTVIKPALKKMQATTPISARDTKASYITNALDRNERMSFIQKQVGHTTTRRIVDHYDRHVPAPDDGNRLEDAWNSTRQGPRMLIFKCLKKQDKNGGGGGSRTRVREPSIQTSTCVYRILLSPPVPPPGRMHRRPARCISPPRAQAIRRGYPARRRPLPGLQEEPGGTAAALGGYGVSIIVCDYV